MTDPQGGPTEKQIILIVPQTSHLFIRLALRFLLHTRSPFALYILAALAPKDYHVKLLNQKLLWLRSDFVSGALVGISCLTSNALEAYRLADRFRAAGSTVVMGGPHVSALPEEALQHCDSVVVGEGESVWPQVIKDFENHDLKKIYRGEPLEDYFSSAYDAFMTRFNPRVFYRSWILLSRGCKYCCEFCARLSQKPRYVGLDQAFGLIQRIANAYPRPFGYKPILLFGDDNIFSDPQYAKRLFEKLRPLRIRWAADSSLDIAFDDEALKLAKASGCRLLFIGFESVDPTAFPKTSAGGVRTSEDYIKAIRKIRSYGIRVTGAFIMGLDTHTHLSYLKLLWFFVRARLYLISLTILTPYPGSALYERLSREGRITTRDWSKYDLLHHVVFRPNHMSAAALQIWFVAVRIISVFLSPAFWYSMLQFMLWYWIGYSTMGFFRDLFF